MEIVKDLGVRESPVQTAVSGPAGSFEFKALPAGQYSLKAELPGFISFRKPWLEIMPSQTLTENMNLSVSNVAVRVEVSTAGQRKPLPPAGTPQRIRVGGNVQVARLIAPVKPIYPQSARDAGIEGTVHLQGVIGADGTLTALRVVSSNDADLAAAALESAKQWRYRPTLLNNIPVEVVTDIDMEFRLAQ